MVAAALNLLAGFGLPISDEQKALVVAFLTATAGVVIRTQVRPAKVSLVKRGRHARS